MEGDDRVVQAHAALLLGVGADAGVCQGRVFVAAESKNGLVHVDGIEHAQAYQQLEVVYAQAGDFFEKSRIELGDDILQRVFPEIGQVYEGRDAGGELDQLFLDLLALGLVVLLLLAELPLLLESEGLAFSFLVLETDSLLLTTVSKMSEPSARKPSIFMIASMTLAFSMMRLRVWLSTFTRTADSHSLASRVAEVPAMAISRISPTLISFMLAPS